MHGEYSTITIPTRWRKSNKAKHPGIYPWMEHAYTNRVYILVNDYSDPPISPASTESANAPTQCKAVRQICV